MSAVIDLLHDRQIQMLLVLVALSLLIVAVNGVHLGIDFVGGTRIPLTASAPMDQDQINDVLAKLQSRTSSFGLKEVKVRAVGNTEIYVEVAESDSSLLEQIQRIVKEKGTYEGLVDGKVAITNKGIYPGTIRTSTTKVGQYAQWKVEFVVTPEASQQFADTAKGKAHKPLYMFLDRPTDSIVVISRADLVSGTSLSEAEALDLAQKALTREDKTIPVFVLDDWASVKNEINGSVAITNKSTAIISTEAPAEVKKGLTGLGFKITEIEPAKLSPTYSLQTSPTEPYRFVNRWDAVGLLSAPALGSTVTDGTPSSGYLIEGTSQGTDPVTAANTEGRFIASILTGGALPVELTAGSTTTIPAPLGAEFLKWSVVAAIAALAGIVALIALRYRTMKIILPIIFVSVVEMIILVAIIGSFTIDLGGMAGIIAALGVSVDAQIVVTDELLKHSSMKGSAKGAKAKMNKAFSIVVTNAVVAIVAMIPLLLFSNLVEIIGFATSTILGAILGVLITRPAYGAIVEKLFEKEIEEDAEAEQ
ncbi:Protein-export membrane protein SecD [Candidatus Gugararchaeum adminiculabundum]|nr:Protein-export membrane protein SecD [Candidatus Gugararchaeum adminiculabundum]